MVQHCRRGRRKAGMKHGQVGMKAEIQLTVEIQLFHLYNYLRGTRQSRHMQPKEQKQKQT